jgi:nucleoside-diphosphate-sugar epimerase
VKIVVTGAAGYIGASAVARLLTAGHEVHGLDCLRFGGAALLGSYLTGRFALTRGDIRDRCAVAQAVAGADAVVHLAGIVRDPACAAEPDLAGQVNLDAVSTVRELAGDAGVARFVFASTCSVYGHCAEPAGESSPLRPLSLYARSKADAEARLLTPGTDGMTVTVLRFATVYGLAPRMRFDLVVNAFVAQALTAGRIQVFTPAPGDRRDYRISTGKLTTATGWTANRTLAGGVAELADALSAGVLDGHPALEHYRAA